MHDIEGNFVKTILIIILYFRLHLKELGHPIVYDTLYGSGETLSFPLEESFLFTLEIFYANCKTVTMVFFFQLG